MEKRVQDYTQEILDTIRHVNSSPAVMAAAWKITTKMTWQMFCRF